MRINTNIASMNAQTNAANTNKSLSTSLEKLSSGLRINKAADDASGMAIADKLRTQASSLGQGISNANSGAALIQIADKALGEQSNILDTVKTKLIQASTSTTSSEGREAIRKDITKLLEQFDAISEQTNYNGINLLNEKGSEFNFQTGEYAESNISMELTRAVNTDSLGATDGSKTSDASGAITVTESIDFDDDKKGGEVDVRVTSVATAGVSISSTAGAASVSISGNDVQKITSDTGAVTLKTDDSELIAKLDAIAATDGGTNFTRNGEGNYTIVSGKTLDFGDEGMDLTDVELITTAADVSAVIVQKGTEESLNVKKLDSAADITVAATADSIDMVIDVADMSKMTMSTADAQGISLTSGTTSVKVGSDFTASSPDKAVAIGLNAGSTSVSDLSFSIDAEDVTALTIQGSAVGIADVVLSSNDNSTIDMLTNASQTNSDLTDNGDGTFTLKTATAGGQASISFDDGFDISNLEVSGLTSGATTATSEKLFIQTEEAVTITAAEGSDEISLVATDMNDATQAAEIGLAGAETSKTVVGDQLSHLKDLGEDGLTADKAMSFMSSVDTALNQLNDVRADFGSTQSQVETAIRSMMVTQVNIKNAESVIRDTDYAAESANFNKQNIIAQAGTYAMSQANAMAQNVQKLLQ